MKAKKFEKKDLEEIETLLTDCVKMNPTSKKTWLNNLRSGKYKQGTKTLYDGFDDSFCCLGVYCRQKKLPLSEIEGEKMPADTEDWMKFKVPHEIGEKMAQLIGRKLVIPSMEVFLASMNDGGYSFEEIAKVIEKIL